MNSKLISLCGMAAALAVALALPLAAMATVIEAKTLTRAGEPVVVKGSDTPGYYGLLVNNTDATLSPNQIFVWAYDSATGWRQVVFQIDEINNANPSAPPPICTDGSHIGLGPNHMEADDGLWDSNDELVFMAEESGDRVTQDEWAPGAVSTAPRYEITVVDPLDTSKKGWVYLFRYDSVPTWRNDDYVSWNETTNTVSAEDYSVDYPDSHTSALYFTNLSVTVAGGGTGANLVQKSKWYWYGGFTFPCGSAETAIRTEQTITGGGCVTMVLPWYAKDGRVRVLRYFIWSPYCASVTNGIGFWPCVHHYYYKSYWQEDHNDKFHGGSGHTDYWWSTVNHANITNMTFYDSNGENCTIDGTSETMANTPLWTWYQVSSPYGSYIKVLRDTAKLVSPDNRKNLYTDSGTAQLGDAGYRIENPTETYEDAWDHFYYFFLPANAANQGATYNTKVDSPLYIMSPVSQNQVSAPAFTGIQSAVDLNGACADEGVQLTWAAVTDWKDGCSANCTGRRFEITRGGASLATVTDTSVKTYTDTTGTNGVTYAYGVEACGNTGYCTSVGTTASGADYVAATPQLSSATTTVGDADLCTGNGIIVSWIAPTDWRDNGEGSKKIELYWDGDAYAAPIATGITSPYTYNAPDGESHAYRLRAVNGCGLHTDYNVSVSVTDAVGTAPTLPADVALHGTDLSACSFSGLQFTWEPVAFWGDGGQGTRGYNLYSSRDGYAAPLISNAASPLLFSPPDTAAYNYRLVAANGCALTSAYAEISLADAQTAPAFSGVTSATDGNLCLASPLTLSWPAVAGDGITGWNDGGTGSGTRHFEIYRGGLLVGTAGETAVSAADQPPATNTAYIYAVRAVNRNGCYTDSGASVSGTDRTSVAPVASPALTAATDIACDSGSGVTVSWDAVSDWGDGGQGIANRRYRVFWSGDNYASPIASLVDGTTSLNYNPPDNLPYQYQVQARNGCGTGSLYAKSSGVVDKTSCSPPCTPVLENNFDGSNSFAQSCYTAPNLWTLTPGVGYLGSQAWRFTAPQGTGPVTYNSTDVPKTAGTSGVTSVLTTATAQPVTSATVAWTVAEANGDPTRYSVEILGPAGGSYTVLKAMGSAVDPGMASITALYNGTGQGAGVYTLRVTHSNAGNPKEATLSAWSITADDGQTPTNATSSIEMSSAASIAWTSDVKLRFWSSVDLATDDAGMVELWTDDSASWRKVTAMLYPAQQAEVPASVNAVCASDVLPAPQPAFQGTVAGGFYEARLDSLLTTSTTQIKVRFKAAVGGTPGAGTWTVDEVKVGYGITDGVYYWSLNGDPNQGAVREALGNEALLSWEDGGFYQTQEFHVYRSNNPAAIRSDATSLLAHTEPDTDVASYTFTTADGAPPEGTCWYYKVYGFKEPCGESNAGEN